METIEVPAKGYFIKERNELIKFFHLEFFSSNLVQVNKLTKDEFLKMNPSIIESDYLNFKYLVDIFKKRGESSYKEFDSLLENEYGYYLNKIREQKLIKQSDNINLIKNILVFFTWLWSIGTIVTIVILLV